MIMKSKMLKIKTLKLMIHSFMKMMLLKQKNIQSMDGSNIMVI
jgi:hypothetical protein